MPKAVKTDTVRTVLGRLPLGVEYEGNDVRFDVTIMLGMENMAFYNVTPCSLIDRYKCFGKRTCCLHLHGRKYFSQINGFSIDVLKRYVARHEAPDLDNPALKSRNLQCLIPDRRDIRLVTSPDVSLLRALHFTPALP
jgi:hypothetical protein